MHDSQIENQVRTALHGEADRLPMTITAAELERRLGARRRASANFRFRAGAATVAAVLIVAIVAGGNGLLNLPAIGGVVVPSASPNPSTSPIPSATPQPGATATPRIREAKDIGSEGEAILVRPIGEALRPEAFEVTRFDPVRGTSSPIATIPGTVLPPDAEMHGTFGERPIVSLTGYLAIPIERGPNADAMTSGFVVVDLTDPSIPPVVFDNYRAMSWDVADNLALMAGDHIDIAFASSSDVYPFANPDPNVSVVRAYDGSGPATSTEEGSRFLGTKTEGGATTSGAIGYDAVFRPTTDLPPVYQRTGLERPAGAAAHTLSRACDTSTTTTACVLVESDATGKPVRNLPLTGGGMVYDDVWAVDGTHIWMLVETIAAESRMATLTYAAIQDARTDRAALELTGGDGWPRILGITTETDDGHALVAIGDPYGFVRAFVAPDGTVTPQDGSAWIAGWGGQQPDYDPD